MISRRAFIYTASAGVAAKALISAGPASAHREAASRTKIIWSEPDKSLHITHRLHTDDVQRALFHAKRIKRPDLSPLKAQAALALYMSDTFSISSEDGPLDLDIIGAEIIGRNVNVYHTAPLLTRPRNVIVKITSFQNIIDGFINHLDIETQDGTSSHRQTKNSLPITVAF